MLIWFKSDAFIEYMSLLGLSKFVKDKEYKLEKFENLNLNYPSFLKMKYDKLATKKVTVLYGEKEPDGKKVTGLDALNGHFDAKKNYHYHATQTYPYINGGFKGVVTEIDGQVDPQSLTKAFRPAGEPLRGAVITDLERTDPNSFDLTYSLNRVSGHVKYTATLSQVNMEFTDPAGAVRNETYLRK
jgi:hypothetical protein